MVSAAHCLNPRPSCEEKLAAQSDHLEGERLGNSKELRRIRLGPDVRRTAFSFSEDRVWCLGLRV